MTIRLTETVIDELRTLLSTYLPANITTYAAFSPAIDRMTAPAEYSFGDKINQQRPGISVTPVYSPAIDDKVGGQAFRHRIAIGIHLQEGDAEYLARMAQRYTAAVIKTFMQRRTTSSVTFRALQIATEAGGGIDWGATMAAGPKVFYRDIFFEITCDTDEDL